MKYLAILFSFLPALSSFGAIHTAASASREHVGAAYALCAHGDTLRIPAGDEPWTYTLYIDLGITIEGAGIGTTILRDNITKIANNNYSEAMFVFTVPAGQRARITGIEFVPGDRATAYQSGTIQVHGDLGVDWVMDNCRMTLTKNRGVYYWAGIPGVIHDSQFYCNERQATVHSQSTMGGKTYGDWSWENSYRMGNVGKALYAENCVFTQATSNNNPGATDGFHGGRMVFRRCTIDGKIGNHGTESTNSARGGRQLDAYQNTFTTDVASAVVAIDYRSGSGVIFGNSFLSAPSTSFKYDKAFQGNAYRAWLSYRPWGAADGTSLFDVNDTSDGAGTPGGAGDGVFDSGTATEANTLGYADTGGITATQSGTTITASSGVFTSAMVGKTFQWFPSWNGTPNKLISAYISPTAVTVSVSATQSTPKGFIVGTPKSLTDGAKSWGSNQWAGYTLRSRFAYTATSGGLRTATVSGANWPVNCWAQWEITETATNERSLVASNTANTITTYTGDNFDSDFTGGGAFTLSRGTQILSNNGTTLTLDGQGSVEPDYVYPAGNTYEIRKVTRMLDQMGAGITDPITAPPTRSRITHRNLNQGIDPVYAFSNVLTGVNNYYTDVYPTIIENRDYYLENASFTSSPTTGVGVGPIAARPSSGLVAGVGWWATDQGEWDSTNGATPDGQLYRATGPTTWELYYLPLQYPHPSRYDLSPDVTDPEVTSVSVNGSVVTVNFNESTQGGAAGNFTFSTGTLSALSGTGPVRTMALSPPAEFGATYTINHTPGGIQDAAGNPLGSFTGFSVTNNTPDPGTPDPPVTQNPGRRRGAGRILGR